MAARRRRRRVVVLCVVAMYSYNRCIQGCRQEPAQLTQRKLFKLGSNPFPPSYDNMGAGQSTSQAHPPKRGLHVLRVTPSSPASQTNIEPFFDFVVGFEGNSLSSEKSVDVAQLEKIVEGHEGRTLNLLVWNAKSQRTRGVYAKRWTSAC
jgi:hypothetical protein